MEAAARRIWTSNTSAHLRSPARTTHPSAEKRRRRASRARTFFSFLCLCAVLAAAVFYAQQHDMFLKGIDVEPVMQNPQLPNGCEAASLAAVLNALGVSVDKMDLAYGYIPRMDFEETGLQRIGPDPETAYPGDPATSRGFYCFAAPVCEGANRLLEERGSRLRAVDITGVTQQGLREYLKQGDAVIVWTTLDFSPPVKGSFTWTDEATGETIVPYYNLHCIVLTGMGQTKCVVVDPLQGQKRVDLDDFLRSFEEVGSMAAVIH